MTKYQLLQLKLSKYPADVQKAILNGLLKAAKKKIVAYQENDLSKRLKSKLENDIFDTEYGTIYFNKSNKVDNKPEE